MWNNLHNIEFFVIHLKFHLNQNLAILGEKEKFYTASYVKVNDKDSLTFAFFWNVTFHYDRLLVVVDFHISVILFTYFILF